MTDRPPFPAEQRPRDFSARLTRAGGSRPVAWREGRKHSGRRLAALAAMVAVPAMAATGGWRDPAIAASAPLAPMGFETPGESFPGSAFYYLDEQPYSPATADARPAVEAGYALPRHAAGGMAAGQAARALRFAGSATDRVRAQQCLTMAVYYEAANESDAGQRAVAQVVLNRLAHPGYPDTVCGVVFQGSERSTGCQFTFTCDGSLARMPARTWWNRAAGVARAALSGAVYAPVGLATHYHTVAVHPYWADTLDHVDTIGAHRFYRWRGAAGRAAAFTDRYLGGEPAARPHPRRPQPSAAEDDPVAPVHAFEAPPPQAAAQSAAAETNALPASGGIRPEYARSGQWLRQP